MKLLAARPGVPISRRDPFDAATMLLLGGLAVLAFVTFRDYGMSNDEPVQQRYGELIIAYYTSGFTDRRLFALENLYLYGGLFDVMATLIAKAVPLDVYHVRHLICALFGIGGIAATWAMARLIAGPRAGLIAAALLAVCGIWYGGMFNHTKDVTFAAVMAGATYALLRATRDLPRPRLRDVLLFGIILGAALGLRALGLLLGIYLGLAILLGLIDSRLDSMRNRLAFICGSIVAFIPGLVLGYLIMIVVWPWSALNPLNPVRAIFAFSDFHYPIRDVFDGKIYRMDEMPRSYVPVYLAIKLPLLMLAGLVPALWFAVKPWRGERATAPRTRRELAFVAFTAIIPVTAHVIGHGPAFSGMRHFMFVVPALAILAGFGLDALWQALERRGRVAAAALGAAIAAVLVGNIVTLVRLHPHEYLDYNSLVGGLQGADGRYATDYWDNTMPETLDALKAFIARNVDRPGQPLQHFNVAVCAHRLQFDNIAPARLHWTDTWEEAHFFISPTHMKCDNMMEGRIIATVERLGIVLAVVKDRRHLIDPMFAKRSPPSGDVRARP